MIQVQDLTVYMGNFVLAGVSFAVPPGQYVMLMGKTGSGKTTLLETICGLRRLQTAAGRIALAGRDVTFLRPSERGVGYVPQDGALFPTMSVAEHLAFALRIRKLPRKVIAERVAELAALLHIEHLLGRRAVGLSGGEAQRVALGRALAIKPAVLCLDEPLNALDDETHGDMCRLLQRTCRQAGITTLHVSHNREEARLLADRVLTLRAGRLAEDCVQTPAGARES